MTLILSIDLASRDYSDFGLCLLEESSGTVKRISYPRVTDLHLNGIPHPESFVERVASYCKQEGTSILLLDGPQGWKDPQNGLIHSRCCDKAWNTQAKIGIFGNVKPSTFTRFVLFSVEVFRLLMESCLMELVNNEHIRISPGKVLLAESYPYSAWRSLGLKPLAGKKKCNDFSVQSTAQYLRRNLFLPPVGKPTHDELCALVAGLAGVAVASGNESGYIAKGKAPFWVSEGGLLEGFIVNPVKSEYCLS